MSGTLSEAETLDVGRVNALAAGCNSADGFIEQVLPAVRDCFHLSVSTLSRREQDRIDTPDLVAFCGGRSGAAEDYHRYYRHLANPYRKRFAGPSASVRAVVDTQDVFDEIKSRDASRLYYEFQAPMGMDRSMAIILSSDPRNRATLGLWRQRAMAKFDAIDMLKARLIAPVLSEAYSRVHRDSSGRQISWLLQWLDPLCVAEPIILTDNLGAVTFANLAAQKILGTLMDEGLMAPSRQMLVGALARLCGETSALDDGCATASPAMSDRSRFARAVRIPHDFGGGYLVRFTATAPASNAKRKLEGYGLTPREIEVIEAAAVGQSNKQIARNLNISYYTVQDHLKAIYRKLNVNNRVCLTNFALTS